jgi:hypothetical protein
MFEVRFYETAAGRSQARDFLDALQKGDRLSIAADIEEFRLKGLTGTVSTRTIQGLSNRGLAEIKTGGFRTFFTIKRGVIWILHVCKKEHQKQGIKAARVRMALL